MPSSQQIYDGLVGLALGLVAGVIFGWSRGTAQGAAELQTYQAKVQQDSAATALQAVRQFGTRLQFGDLLSSQLIADTRAISDQASQQHAKVPNVTSVYRAAPSAAPQPLPVCVFTRGWVREYNAAIGAAVPDSAQATGVPAETADAGTTAARVDELAPAAVDQADVLNHHIDYGARAREIEAQLNRLIDYEEGAGAQ